LFTAYIDDLEAEAKGVDIVLPRRNRLQPGSFVGQYERCHPVEPFYLMLDLMERRDHKMAAAAREYFNQFEYAYWNNLFITSFELYSYYCEFAFDLLLQVDTELDSKHIAFNSSDTSRGLYQNRVCAFLSERLLNFWIHYNELTIREVDWCVTSEIQNPPESHQVALKI